MDLVIPFHHRFPYAMQSFSEILKAENRGQPMVRLINRIELTITFQFFRRKTIAKRPKLQSKCVSNCEMGQCAMWCQAKENALNTLTLIVWHLLLIKMMARTWFPLYFSPLALFKFWFRSASIGCDAETTKINLHPIRNYSIKYLHIEIVMVSQFQKIT